METYEVLQDVMNYIGDCIDNENEIDLMDLYNWIDSIMLKERILSKLRGIE